MSGDLTGATLAGYRVTAKLGEGGMGEVWRATDTRLGREVAIKLLPAALQADRERLARFEREAKLLAQLNHPNIAQIYGLESQGDLRALVMELVEGPTLAERLESGPLPWVDCLSLSSQIAQALEEAHEKGIVHRDLKPQNIKASLEGRIKVLDFGLAKALEPAGLAGAEALANSPTVTLGGTREGTILGTAAYMAPEQARGGTVDRRADIWAFGVVLYEMLTGERLFAEASVVDTLSAVMRKPIDLGRLPVATPGRLVELVRRCLERDPRQRLRDIGEARFALEQLRSGRSDEPSTAAAGGTGRRIPAALPWILAALATLAALGSAWIGIRAAERKAPPPSRFGLLVPPPFFPPRSQLPMIDLSADGRTLLFVAESGGRTKVFRRNLDRLEAEPIAGTDGGEHPILSPDGRWVAFFADGKLRRVPAGGGAASVLADARAPRGAAWLPDGSLVLSPRFNSGLWRVPATGGAPEELTRLEAAEGERSHRWPQVLPDGRTVLFTVGLVTSPGDYDDAEIEAIRLGSGERRTLLTGARMARYAPSGHLVFQRRASLLAVRFDAAALEVRGEPFVIEEGVGGDASSGAGYFAVGARDELAFVPESAIPKERALLLVDRDGGETALPVEPAAFNRPRFSPTGDRLAFGVGSGAAADDDVYLFDLGSGRLQRLTFGGGRGAPLWSPDGTRIAYTMGRSGESGLAVRAADGTGEEARIAGSGLFYADAWLPDGRLIVTDYEGTFDIRLLDPGAAGVVSLAASAQLAEYAPALSPDGRLLAYTSTEAGGDEIFVESFPPGAGKWQVSTAGGICPIWSRQGDELFYVSGSNLMGVAVDRGPAFRAGAPKVVLGDLHDLCDPPRRHYDVGPDGRFVVVSREVVSAAPRELVYSSGWASADPALAGSEEQRDRP